jgi:hypothetical protein
MADLINLKPFIDFGGVFVLSVIIIYIIAKRLDKLEECVSKCTQLIILSIRDKVSEEKIMEVLNSPKK